MCVMPLALLAGTAFAQTKTLYIGMNGGTMEKAYTEHVFPAFEKANNAKVVVVPGVRAVELGGDVIIIEAVPKPEPIPE